MQLRKCCNHPYIFPSLPSFLLVTKLTFDLSHSYLLPNAESEPFEVAEHLVAASSKLVLLDKLLAEILPKGEKVLIFSGFTRMLDILEDFMQLRGFKCDFPFLPILVDRSLTWGETQMHDSMDLLLDLVVL